MSLSDFGHQLSCLCLPKLNIPVFCSAYTNILKHSKTAQGFLQGEFEDGVFLVPPPDRHEILVHVLSPNKVVGASLKSILSC